MYLYVWLTDTVEWGEARLAVPP